MKSRTFMKSLLVGLLGLAVSLPVTSWARGYRDAIDVDIINDRGREFRQYSVPSRGKDRNITTRAYVEAKKGRNYAIRVRNNTDRRMGVVIAVDGRNIISGRKSHLDNDERMYILRPYESAVYEGWRTSKNRVNRFFFTDAGDSYADAFRDHSAMGVIAVAAYPEKHKRPRYDDERSIASQGSPMKRRGDSPGTGFGESEWSPSRRVDFDPVRNPAAKYFVKYEWRKDLCRKGIIDCRENLRPQPPRNRFWPGANDGYAPYPPNWRDDIFRGSYD